MILEDVGVVAIGRNEGERLIRCLRSVGSVSHNIVYVDSGSTDGSVRAAKQSGAHVVKLDLSRPFTAARARNEGFAALLATAANIRFVQFIDGDCVLDHGWLGSAREFMENRSDIAIVCGRRRELYPAASVYNQACEIEWKWNAVVGETEWCGGDTLVRVSAFQAATGFRSELIAGEEPELCVRLRELGWRIWRLDAEMTQHDAAITRIGQFWNRAVRSGHAYAEVSRLHGRSTYGIWKREFRSAIFWGGLLPFIILFGAAISPAAFVFAFAYAFLIVRVAFLLGARSWHSWTFAFLVPIAKFAQFQGVMRFYWSKFVQQNVGLIEYK